MLATVCYSEIDSPLGSLFLRGEEDSITGLFLPDHKRWRGPDPAWQRSDAAFTAARRQLAEYFAGERQEFDLPLRPEGTAFQQKVWHELRQIPFGTTITYAELARRIGQPAAARAVGHANGRNPISIIVPCHRVIGAGGSLTGYAGGVAKKQWLLDWERRNTGPAPRNLFDREASPVARANASQANTRG
jgi:methylated-DNA-[protein]-cysteine S-methyltransferase